MCYLSIISSDIVPTSSKRKRRIIVYGLVTRYHSSAISYQRKWLTPCHARREFFVPKLQYFLSLYFLNLIIITQAATNNKFIIF